MAFVLCHCIKSTELKVFAVKHSSSTGPSRILFTFYFNAVDAASTNLPSSRSEFPVASVSDQAVLYGGYSIALKRWLQYANAMDDFVYLGDTFWYDATKQSWRFVYCDKYPENRAGSALVYVAPDSSDTKMKGKDKDKDGIPGSFIMLGGYDAEHGDRMDVWELKVRARLRARRLCKSLQIDRLCRLMTRCNFPSFYFFCCSYLMCFEL